MVPVGAAAGLLAAGLAVRLARRPARSSAPAGWLVVAAGAARMLPAGHWLP